MKERGAGLQDIAQPVVFPFDTDYFLEYTSTNVLTEGRGWLCETSGGFT